MVSIENSFDDENASFTISGSVLCEVFPWEINADYPFRLASLPVQYSSCSPNSLTS